MGRNDTNVVYEGSPKEIINRLSREITDALNTGGVSASGVCALAMIHVAASLLRHVNEGKDMGKPPEMRTVLTVLLRGIDNGRWSNEELGEFNEDFCAIVESLGGVRLGPKEMGISIMSPTLGVH